jgi:hypothetical protein
MKTKLKAFSYIFILLHFSNAIFCQTTIFGNILTDTTLTLSSSPFIVTSNLVVFEDAILTVEPGVELKFNENTGIILRGKLVSIGTETERIIYTSNLSNPTLGSWNGINTIGVTDPIGEGNQITMKYSDGLYSNNFVNLDLAYHGPYIFQNCNFMYNNSVNYDGGSPVTQFDSCTFFNNNTGLNPFQFQSKIAHCSFINNIDGAIGVDIADSCFFIGNTGIALLPHIATTACYFESNNIAVHGNFNSTNSIFRNNQISENEIGVEINSFFGNTIDFSGNTICENVLNINLTSPNNADLSNNCWCDLAENGISDLINDNLDDTSLGHVTFNPIGINCENNDLGIFHEQNNSSLSIFPNPFQEKLTVNSIESEISFIELIDIQGRLIMENSFIQTVTLDTSELEKGIYLFRINSNNVIKEGKISKN